MIDPNTKAHVTIIKVVLGIMMAAWIFMLVASCSPHRKTSFYKDEAKWEVKHDYGTFNENKK